MNFDVINVGYLGQGLNTTSFVSIDLMLSQDGDIVIMPDGNLGNVSGSLKLAQDIKLFLLSPLGTSILDATWGNASANLIGAAPAGNGIIQAAIFGAVQTLKRFKDNEENVRGYPLEGSELIAAISDVIIQQTDHPNVFNVTVSVVDKTGALNAFQITLQ